MTTKITVIYDNPTDLEAFEQAIADLNQEEVARSLPGLDGDRSNSPPQDDPRA
ncbi:hypothetical protein [Occultella gossypii]|uniref:Uncharacterized protein n=1 Tax=Occultella gossypii TaxID=2800820 RepID=A0ABS7S875_9MICO|nr:hypothetical protein [Occultella gossypii]MBZ2195476.1 hypothetical protein [Occultella gossypii]